MKVILTASRNAALDRPAFFRHLREVHWPLVSRYPNILREVQKYTQNHSFLPQEDGGVATPWRRAIERDSVIEVWFDGVQSLQRMDADPDYVTHVRPDEAYFNDLPNNVLLAAEETVYHTMPSAGRIKRFDFLYAALGSDGDEFEQGCREACSALAFDPLFQALADTQSLHLPLRPEDRAGAQVQAVVATTASGLPAMNQLASVRFVERFKTLADCERCFSVLATCFPTYPTAPR